MARINKNLSYPENIIDSIKTTYDFLEPVEATGEEILKSIQDERTNLTPRQKLVIAMRFEKKMPAKDTAEAIHRSTQTVHNIEDKALMKIRRGVKRNAIDKEHGRLYTKDLNKVVKDYPYDFEGYFAHLDTQFSNAICAINSLIINDIAPDEMKDSLCFAVRQLECQRAISEGFYDAGYAKDLPRHTFFKKELERMKNEENNSRKDKEVFEDE